MNNKKSITLNIMFVIIGIAVVCSLIKERVTIKEPVTIGHLAYDANEQFGYTVYIKETDGYKPYIVLTNNYNGNTLLMRQYLLPEELSFKPMYPNDECTSYYENSDVDKYLNGKYKETLDETVREKIVPSTIIIIAKNSLASTDMDMLEIVRDVFLLSRTEINQDDIGYVEGKPLKYFNSLDERYMARLETEEEGSWWLRTPSTLSGRAVIGVTYEGRIGLGEPYDESGIRPVFCVSSDELISKRDDIIPNETVYVLE